MDNPVNWSFSGRRGVSKYVTWTRVLMIVISAFMVPVKSGDWEGASISTMWSSDPLLPCVYSGEVFNHADSWTVDQDTECHCNDSEVVCDVVTCPYLDCDRPLKVSGEPCVLCYHNVMARSLRADIRARTDVMIAGQPMRMTLDLDVKFEEFSQTTSIEGSGLWKLSAWASSSSDGGGRRHGLIDQVLAKSQSSATYVKEEDFVIRGISFDLVPPSCASTRFVCLSFGRGDAPVTASGLDFIFSRPDENNRDPTTCLPAPSCQKAPPKPLKTHSGLFPWGRRCRVAGASYENGEKWQKNDCTACTCVNGRAACEPEQCEPPYCANPVEIEGNCCPMCPYTVVGKRLQLNAGGTCDSMGFVRTLLVDVEAMFKENKRTTGVQGNRLWKLSAWGSTNQQGDGQRMMYSDQLLTDAQSSQTYIKGNRFQITGVAYNLVEYDVDELQYFCFTFTIGDDPEPEHGLAFQLKGFTADTVTCLRASRCSAPILEDSASDPEPVVVEITTPTQRVFTTTAATTARPDAGGDPETDPNGIPTDGQSSRGTEDNEVTGLDEDRQPTRGGGDIDVGGGNRGLPQRPTEEEEPASPRPCFSRVQERQHGARWYPDDCTKCICKDATIRCVIRSCQLSCFDPIFLEGTCCPFCPPSVIVNGVSPTIQRAPSSLTIGDRAQLSLSVEVTFKETFETTGVSGTDLWKLSAWTSRKPDGSRPENLVEQTLNDRQRVLRHIFDTPLALDDVPFELNVQTCPEVRFVCVKFAQGNHSITKHNFGFYFDAFPDSRALTACTRLPNCSR